MIGTEQWWWSMGVAGVGAALMVYGAWPWRPSEDRDPDFSKVYVVPVLVGTLLLFIGLAMNPIP